MYRQEKRIFVDLPKVQILELTSSINISQVRPIENSSKSLKIFWMKFTKDLIFSNELVEVIVEASDRVQVGWKIACKFEPLEREVVNGNAVAMRTQKCVQLFRML